MAGQRRSSRGKAAKGESVEIADVVDEQAVKKITSAPKKSKPKAKSTGPDPVTASETETESPEKPVAKKRSGKTKSTEAGVGTPSETETESPEKPAAGKGRGKKKSIEGGVGKDEKSNSPRPKKKAKKQDHQRITEREELPKLWDAKKAMGNGSYTFRIMSWNVAGLRAILRNHPQALCDLAKKYNFDVICLQETKLQEMHVDDPKLKLKGYLLEEEGYDSHYSCSVTKKGYSGTAVFVKRHGKKKEKQKSIGSYFGQKAGGDSSQKHQTDFDTALLVPEGVSYGIGVSEHDAEGRTITLDFPLFSLTNAYVPNSGQKLDRLSYRTDNWDEDLFDFLRNKQKARSVPTILAGDLNVAHTGMEVWNEGAKHLAKSAGTTPEERASFKRQLDTGFVDAFRHLHPTAQGQYTYWSQRAGNREPNKGLRLDYFICDPSLMEDSGKVTVRDSYMLHEQVGSDHCPIVLELEVKQMNE